MSQFIVGYHMFSASLETPWRCCVIIIITVTCDICVILLFTGCCRLGWLRQEVGETRCATKLTRSTTMELMMPTGKARFYQYDVWFCHSGVFSALHREPMFVFFLQPWWSSIRWKHAWPLPGHLRRVWWWLRGRGTNCPDWKMHSNVQLPWYDVVVLTDGPTPHVCSKWWPEISFMLTFFEFSAGVNPLQSFSHW